MSNGTEKCQICYFSFNSAELMVNHLREYLNNDDQLHKSATYRCNLCGNECFGGDKFVFHMDTLHFSEPGTSQTMGRSDADKSLRGVRKYKCSDCGKSFHRPSELLRHIRTHDG
ncbi:zinc finger, c2H2 type domain-containing protein [Ditylenchus destructor]|nr:zinc finger, c2H2 type domain-containing protein [Ditylenchus destructor]